MVAKGLENCARWLAGEDPRCIVAAGAMREGRKGPCRDPGVGGTRQRSTAPALPAPRALHTQCAWLTQPGFALFAKGATLRANGQHLLVQRGLPATAPARALRQRCEHPKRPAGAIESPTALSANDRCLLLQRGLPATASKGGVGCPWGVYHAPYSLILKAVLVLTLAEPAAKKTLRALKMRVFLNPEEDNPPPRVWMPGHPEGVRIRQEAQSDKRQKTATSPTKELFSTPHRETNRKFGNGANKERRLARSPLHRLAAGRKGARRS